MALIHRTARGLDINALLHIKGLRPEVTSAPENLPSPLFVKSRGPRDSLWKREVGRDFTNQYCHYYETVNNSQSSNLPAGPLSLPGPAARSAILLSVHSAGSSIRVTLGPRSQDPAFKMASMARGAASREFKTSVIILYANSSTSFTIRSRISLSWPSSLFSKGRLR